MATEIVDSDDCDWFDKDESELLADLKIKLINSADETCNGLTAAEQYIKERKHKALTARPHVTPQIITAELRKIAQLEPLDAFLAAITHDHDFWHKQIAHNDSMERVLLYTRIMANICHLELPAFQHEILSSFVRNEDLLEHFCYLSTKLFVKPYNNIWKDMHQVDEIVQHMQILLLHSFQAELFNENCWQVLHHIKTMFSTNPGNEITQRDSCIAFAKEINRLLSLRPQPTNSGSEAMQEKYHEDVYPSLAELLHPPAVEESEVNHKPDDTQMSANVQSAKVNSYIEMQKKTLRDGFISSLRACILSIKENRYMEVFPHLKVFMNTMIVLNEQFLSARRHEMMFVKVTGQKDNVSFIKVGALLCFSSDEKFENLILARVTYTDKELISQGYLGIEIVRQYNIGRVFDRKLLMFETPDFFEPYHNVYKYLISCSAVDLPMQKYIVLEETKPQAPAYLNNTISYNYEKHKFQPLENFKRPQQLPLNECQFAAYKAALTQEFCLIQGPPGTGKTHLSVHLVKTLIESKLSLPIVLVTYTNESLDKFLLKISVHTTSIARFGSQTRQKDIARFNIASFVNVAPNPKLKRLYYLVDMEFKAKFDSLQFLHQEFDGSEESYQKILKAQAELQFVASKLATLRTLFQYYEVRHKAIIAMTTTCAAKTNFLFRLLKSSIVIFEEAAEIMEPHILACLTPYTQHVIQIGDQMQLKPYTNLHNVRRSDARQLQKLNVSLFERLIEHKFEVLVLQRQYRMRPIIADLLCPEFYERLENDDVVETYPLVRGMTENLYFLKHNKPEKFNKDSYSIQNDEEIAEIIKLAQHLKIVGAYEAEDIVILSPYMKQVQEIQKKLAKMQFDDVKVHTVDSFQGLEANIVLLSLVRSNDKNQIGFLEEKNRICVALSRAKHGLYIMGNLEMLAAQNKTWANLQKKFEMHNAVGSEFPYEKK